MYSKYRAKKTVVDGIKFDSKKESKRYLELKQMQEQGIIRDLTLQPKFVLIPKQFSKTEKTKQGKPKVIERECVYFADFSYFNCTDDNFIVEDVKGVKTPEYKLKKKLLLYVHGIRIKEI